MPGGGDDLVDLREHAISFGTGARMLAAPWTARHAVRSPGPDGAVYAGRKSSATPLMQ
jgi:hypothetical protein